MREKLPNDGAPFRCSFATDLYGSYWRCPNLATEAIHPDSMPEMKDIPKHVIIIVINGRAMCEKHLKFFGV